MILSVSLANYAFVRHHGSCCTHSRVSTGAHACEIEYSGHVHSLSFIFRLSILSSLQKLHVANQRTASVGTKGSGKNSHFRVRPFFELIPLTISFSCRYSGLVTLDRIPLHCSHGEESAARSGTFVLAPPFSIYGCCLSHLHATYTYIISIFLFRSSHRMPPRGTRVPICSTRMPCANNSSESVRI